MIEANSNAIPYWDSSPDSACSEDDLPPAAPTNFSGSFNEGTSTFTFNWDPNQELDLGGYRLYRGSTPDFVTNPGNRVAEPLTNATQLPAAGGNYFKLSAVDVHENESSAVSPPGILGRPNSGLLPSTLSLAVGPNPSSSRTTFTLGVPRRDQVSLVVHDLVGRQVRAIHRGELDAGEHRVEWNLGTDRGTPVVAGTYLVTLSSNGVRVTRSLIVIK